MSNGQGNGFISEINPAINCDLETVDKFYIMFLFEGPNYNYFNI